MVGSVSWIFSGTSKKKKNHKASDIKSQLNEKSLDLFYVSSSSTQSVTHTQLLHVNCMSNIILSKDSMRLKGSRGVMNIWLSYSSSC